MHTKCQNPDAFDKCSAARGCNRDGERFCAIDVREKDECPKTIKEQGEKGVNKDVLQS